MRALRPDAILKRVLESYPSATFVEAADKVAASLESSGVQLSGRTIRSYCKGERRPSAKFCEAFAAAFGPFELDDWIDRDELPTPSISKSAALSAGEREARRLQVLINRFCEWCAGYDHTSRMPRCPDAACVLRPACPYPTDATSRSLGPSRVSVPDSWD